MSRCQLSQFNMDEEFWEDARRHGAWLYHRVPPTRVTQGETWLSPRQRQYLDRKLTDLTKLKKFGTTCRTHVKKARRQGKSNSISRGKQGVLVGYDDDQGPLLDRIYFPDTKIFELHDNGYIQYQSFKDQITGVDEPEQEAPEDHPVEFYAPLVGTRHIDPKNGLTYQTVDIKVTPNRDIVAWRRRIIR
jgi:hypothetical protein